MQSNNCADRSTADAHMISLELAPSTPHGHHTAASSTDGSSDPRHLDSRSRDGTPEIEAHRAHLHTRCTLKASLCERTVCTSAADGQCEAAHLYVGITATHHALDLQCATQGNILPHSQQSVMLLHLGFRLVRCYTAVCRCPRNNLRMGTRV